MRTFSSAALIVSILSLAGNQTVIAASAQTKTPPGQTQAFQDALKLWRLAMQDNHVLIYIMDADAKEILNKYNVLQNYPKYPLDARFSYGMWQQEILHPQLQQVWAVALQHAARAETNAR